MRTRQINATQTQTQTQAHTKYDFLIEINEMVHSMKTEFLKLKHIA